jgi:hypothetical protein
MFTVVFEIVALACAAVHLALAKNTRTPRQIAEIVLLYWFAIAIGALGIFEFAGHAFRATRVAASIGWPAGNPFQQEVAFADLTLGVLGLCCIWLRGNFWVATTIAAAVMLWGDALGHIEQIVRYGNHHPGNSGAVLWSELLIPGVAIGLLKFSKC